MSAHIGTAWVRCPECGADMPASITAELTDRDGQQWLACEPDMTDIWAHAWTHREEGQ